ncbi:alpha-L-fucosidase [Alkalihalobacillus oceani]|uniref:Alpha-L-fucosidase n=1 Tax=Halalkalibacter oceani TaxID=1653776 RepID=A0A9X2DLW6_9BACI|nr:alpha-L-fucosidase [Halalkalibacter oceani]MCM3712979.1 alpha-L-fucosidase [Halalkalibacter oceani]
MNVDELRYRQIHMDFHTSPHIEKVGEQFDAEEFAQTLKRAHVNSVTVFARCHHGYLYYESQQNPERIHPHLVNKRLLHEQIEACHKHGIRAPIYITVQWDHYTADEHPEWLVLDENGKPYSQPFHNTLYEPGFYRSLCVNSPYRQFLLKHTEEVLRYFPVDGLFFDIVKPIACSCKYCRAGMKAKGLDPSVKKNRDAYAKEVIHSFMREMTAFVRQHNQACSIFYNRGHIGTDHRSVKDAFTHFELESLPSGHWGYAHFPITMHYARTLGIDCLGQTGKFHTMWGDFHSFKNQAALEYECFRMLALNAKCMIGDQLEPNGKLSPAVYDLIGKVYQQVSLKERWCNEATAVTDIGVFTSEEFVGADSHGLPPEMLGVVRILQEGGHQFDILDTQSELFAYKLLILPDRITVSPFFAAKLEQYLADGGALLASYRSGLNKEGTAFTLSSLGINYVGEAPFSPDFIVPNESLGEGLPETEHVMYLQGLHVEAVESSHVIAPAITPYFNRTWEHYCSHRHTPSAGKAGYPAIIQNEQVIYFIHPVFTQYDENAPKWVKQLVLNAVANLLPEPTLQHDGPSTLLTTVNEQKKERRWIVHLLHYIPERRSKTIDTIEDVIPLFDVELSIKLPSNVKKVTLVPEGKEISFTSKNDRCLFTVPTIEGHQMVSIEFE